MTDDNERAFVVIDKDAVEEVHLEGEEIVAVTLSVVDGPHDDPHEAGFASRDKWSYDFVKVHHD